MQNRKKPRVTSGIQLNKSICIGSLLYADDIVLIQENEDDLQTAMFQLQEVAREYSLTISGWKGRKHRCV